MGTRLSVFNRLFLAFAAIFILLEIVLRLTGLASVSSMVWDGVLLKYRPFASYMNQKENKNKVQYNNLGFHDIDRKSQSPGYRYLFIGDSFVEAVQVPAEKTFTKLAEDSLRKKGLNVEILNAGVMGSNNAYEYLVWKEFFSPKVRVDQVVLAFYAGNDLQFNNEKLAPYFGMAQTNYDVFVKPDGTLKVNIHKVSFLQQLARQATVYSALCNLIYTKLYRLKFRSKNLKIRAERKSEADPRVLNSLWAESREGTLNLFRSWNRELHDKGIAFSILVIPGVSEDDLYGEKAQTKLFLENLKDFCLKENIPLLTLDITGRDNYGLYFFEGKYPAHLNFEGHRKASDQISQWLEHKDAGKFGTANR